MKDLSGCKMEDVIWKMYSYYNYNYDFTPVINLFLKGGEAHFRTIII